MTAQLHSPSHPPGQVPRHIPPRTWWLACGAGKMGPDPGWGSLSLAFLLLALLQPPDSSIHPQSGGWSTHLLLRHGGHPQVLSASTSLGRDRARFGPGAPSSASVLVGRLVGDTSWPGKGGTLPHLAFHHRQESKVCKAAGATRRLSPPRPHRNPKPPIFVFSFLLLWRFPAIKSFLGALQRGSDRPIHLLNRSEQCRVGRRERPPAPPCQTRTGKGLRNRPEGPQVTPERGDR